MNVLTKMSQKRHQKAMREGLFEAFPNPERKGCPGPEIMHAIIAGKIARADEDKWVDHFVMCSPCSKEFYEIRCDRIRKKRFRSGAIASCVTLVLALGVWGWTHYHQGSNGRNTVAQVGAMPALRQQVLNLRNWSGERTDGGAEGVPKPPLELHRWRTSLVIYLPLGSEPGKYEVQLLEGGKALLQVSGIARIANGNTVLRVPADLSKLSSGRYSLGIRQPPWEWRYLPLAVE